MTEQNGVTKSYDYNMKHSGFENADTKRDVQ